jgi:hypothetical protein
MIGRKTTGREKLPYGHFTQHKSHMDYSGTVTGDM